MVGRDLRQERVDGEGILAVWADGEEVVITARHRCHVGDAVALEIPGAAPRVGHEGLGVDGGSGVQAGCPWAEAPMRRSRAANAAAIFGTGKALRFCVEDALAAVFSDF